MTAAPGEFDSRLRLARWHGTDAYQGRRQNRRAEVLIDNAQLCGFFAGLWGSVQTYQHRFAHAFRQADGDFEDIGVENPGRRGSLVRSEYLIERFRVVFESGGGWHCGCADFASSSTCEHSREAAGMRAAQAEITAHMAAGRSQLARNLWRSRVTF
jgi:hypothetical protein